MDPSELEKILRRFRPGSKARQSAEILLDGERHSRQEVAARAGHVKETTIPRVIGMLEEEGVQFETTVGSDGRSSEYRLLGRDSVGGTLLMSQIVSVHLEHDEVTVVYKGADGEQRTATIAVADSSLAIRTDNREFRIT